MNKMRDKLGVVAMMAAMASMGGETGLSFQFGWCVLLFW